MWRDGRRGHLAGHGPGTFASLRSSIDRIHELYEDVDLRTGHRRGAGLNGRRLGVVGGADFSATLFVRPGPRIRDHWGTGLRPAGARRVHGLRSRLGVGEAIRKTQIVHS